MKKFFLQYLIYLLLSGYYCYAGSPNIENDYTSIDCNGQSILKCKSPLAKSALKNIASMTNTNATQNEISKMIYLKYNGKIFKSFQQNELSEAVLSISKQLRCLECSKQILSESQSQFADNIKKEIRTMLLSGMTEDAILTTLGDKYGDEIFQDFKNTRYKKLISLVIGILLLILISIIVIFYIRDLSHYLENRSTINK